VTARANGGIEFDAPKPPRWQSGSSPQHLLVTLLGDYWMHAARPLSSAALVALLEEFGVTTAGARAALSRLGRRGVLEPSRDGRRTYYSLNPAVAQRLTAGGARILSFGTEQQWRGEWTVVAYSLPEEQRDVRHLVRSRLRWLGFAPIYDAVWISPHTSVETVVANLAELGVTTATVFAAPHESSYFGEHSPIEAWDLGSVREVYQDFLSRGDEMLTMLRAGRATPADSLSVRTNLMDTYRRIPTMDPGLPEALMPDGWPRAAARAMFLELYDGLAPLAVLHVQRIVERFDGPVAELVKPTLSKDLLEAAWADGALAGVGSAEDELNQFDSA
jgi:phenylacetic acid degradation operon negative regulatory protein